MDNKKAQLWEVCLKNNIFEGFSDNEIPKIQDIFENILEERNDVAETDFLSLIQIKLKQLKNVSYKDLVPAEKVPIIDFSIKEDDAPLKNLDKLIQDKINERNLDMPDNVNINNNGDMSENKVINTTNPFNYEKNIINTLHDNSDTITKIKNVDTYQTDQTFSKIIHQQNLLLEKIFESQIKI